MQNLFVDSNEEFVVKFTVATDKHGTIFCDLNEDMITKGLEDIKAKPEDFEIKNYSATFRKPSFGDTTELYDSVFTTVDGASVNFNPITARLRKIIFLIKEWDLTGEKTKPTAEEIEKLHPVIANAIGIQLDLEVGGLLQ